ncbi:ATP-binding protein [Pyrobaculum ferrireducens]|uniref:Helicase HerA central domain-containing protein n=1 Tax=Pyrobaculum ferrireducens TaxID=1104324 RepID=G7VG86_9CREN|nr:DUF87 domain-containing protein [Pyrobaculum ferrireducens]AET34285.1 hypothetical protein P186_2909 [Pyrobaculum ferrireducens]
MNYYDKTLALFGLSLLAIAILAKAYPPLALLAVLPVLAWGEEVLVWIYTRVAPLEPVRVLYEEPGVKAAYDPRRRLYHIFWAAEPVLSVYGIEAAPRLHELYSKLSLKSWEWVTYIVVGEMKYIRYTTRKYAPDRLRQVEQVLGEYFVLRRVRPWISSSQKPPAAWPYATSLAFFLLALVSSGWFLLVIPLWLFVYRRVRRWHREPLLTAAVSHMSRASALPASRDMLETMASAEATAFADMPKWAVAFTDWSPGEVQKKFVKAYEGRDTGKRLIRIRELSEFIDRMARYNERPVKIYPFGSKDLHSIYMTQDWIAAYDFWVLRNGVKALSHDLARFPVFYGGSTMAVGRRLELGLDRFGRPVGIDIDALPTAHAVIIGASGTGKSWTVGTWALKLADLGVDLVVIDPHGDYRQLAKLLGARVVNVPRELPKGVLALSKNKYFRRLLEEFSVEVVRGEGGEVDVAATLARLYPSEFVEVGGGHVVYAMDAVAEDEEMLAFYLSLLLIYHYSLLAGQRHEKLRTVVIVDEARLVGSTVAINALGEIESTALRKVKTYALGGRKWGFSIWLIVQAHDDIPRKVLKNAAFVVVFSGNYIYLADTVAELRLTRTDENYLQTSVTPRESTALERRPYSMGVLIVGTRGMKYYMKIPLDMRLKA